ncbi:hypothetical protein [uncultured Robinsoniella sp.]|uniref:hypothetical protein n=1 Tax=uncultured Robinsoniella sp. TaxID=904190 RepID=UPI00374FD27E
MEQKRSILSIEAVPQTRLRYARGISLKENKGWEGCHCVILLNDRMWPYCRSACNMQGYHYA